MSNATPAGAPPGLAARLESAAAACVAVGATLIPLAALTRLYELFVVRRSHPLPPGFLGAELRGLAADVVLACWILAVVAVPVVGIGLVAPRASRALQRVIIGIAVLTGVLLAQYFAVTMVPLGADLYGYSVQDVSATVMTSQGITVAAVGALALAVVAAWFVTGQWRRVRIPRAALPVAYVIAFASLLLHGVLVPRATRFGSDGLYFLALNKTDYFASKSASFLWNRWQLGHDEASLSGYPLLHRASYEDVLGPYLNRAPGRPNLVFVIVEGMGRDFMGPGAAYGGFTPFLDSLAGSNLYWENFMSTAGRTFGVLPSLLGSLPFGPDGFMELGARMPRHETLVSLLRERGYRTDYFTGTDGHYDNIDVFMERQGVDQFVDETRFGAGYGKEPAGEGGFSWGYGDLDLFRRSLELLGPATSTPRLDVYLTITTHEPFLPPRTAYYEAEVDRRIAAMPLSPARRAAYAQYRNIFATWLYLDDAVRFLFQSYQSRPDYARTIFVITGDHRLIPIPPGTRADRYHVPLIIASPLVKAPHRFSSVSSHLDVTPTLLALLHDQYGMLFPDSVAWLGTGIDTATAFRSVHSLALMRVKNQLDDYLDGTHFLSGDELFTLGPGFSLQPSDNGAVRDSVRLKLSRFRALNAFVTSGDHLCPCGTVDTTNTAQRAADDSAWARAGLVGKTPTDAFEQARALATTGQYDNARAVLRRLLRDTPSFHDARLLLGRTYAWQRNFTAAASIYADVLRRDPDYMDAYAAQVELTLYEADGPRALQQADSALARFPRAGELMIDKARALNLLGRRAEALAVLDAVRATDPAIRDARALRAQYSR
ncbi:MAG TPA: sulfatase-like hydrolase/transferase [Gemmatimonadaceae bacterium]|nr:sulfatase-like hydrolase/transferase [Gemmatimonadaceae bacterium]